MSEDNKNYKEIPFESLDYEQPLPCSIYLQLGDKYIKFFNNSDIPNIERVNKLKEKGATFFYIEQEDADAWEMYASVRDQRNKEISDGRVSEGTKQAIEKCRSIASQKIEELYSFKRPDQAISTSSELAASLLKDMDTRPNFIDNFLLTYKDNFTLFEHAYNVATISLSLGKILGYEGTKLKNIGIGAVLHDVGKRDMQNIDPQKAVAEYTMAELDEYKRHPAYGAQFLRKGKSMHEDIYVIVFQHHERINGEGFPQGLKKATFHPLAQLVALANHIDHFLAVHTIKDMKDARELSKNLMLEFLGKHDLKLIKRMAGIVAELAGIDSNSKEAKELLNIDIDKEYEGKEQEKAADPFEAAKDATGDNKEEQANKDTDITISGIDLTPKKK